TGRRSKNNCNKLSSTISYCTCYSPRKRTIMSSSKNVNSSATAISVVVPLRDERPALEELYTRLAAVLTEIADEYEIIFVDDGRTDRSIEKLKGFRAINPSVRYIRFRRN